MEVWIEMPRFRLQDKVTKYKRIRDKPYNHLDVDDIIQLQDPLVGSLYNIEAGEMFRFIEFLHGTLCRVQRISTGKTYKAYAGKFIPDTSMIYVSVWKAREDNCIWNKME